MMMLSYFLLALTLASMTDLADSHGRLIEPPSRSTMWRYGFDTPPNYNDHELYCGGFSRQWRTNGGKCGICGDPWDTPQPRANEAGGMYGKGIIARKYAKNQVIKVRVELTANHMGYFQFRMCPNNNRKKPASQACLDKHLLINVMTEDDKYYPGPGSKVFEMHYQLPKDLTCRQCVFQWRYVAGNNWGTCKNGTGAVGCGPQEEFRACADVAITEDDGTADDTPNNLEDDDVFIPTPRTPISRPDDDRLNEVDFDEERLYDELKIESVIIIVLCSLLATVAFFAGLIFYYTRGKVYWEKYVGEKVDWPEMPSLPPMPKMQLPKKANLPNWPLSNVQVKKLPTFFKKAKSTTSPSSAENNDKKRTVSAPINVVSSTNEAATGPPVKPPPRFNKKNPPPAVPASQVAQPPRLATIASRPHPSSASVTRPSAPPPVVPPIEIGAPTSVTINGVSVSPNGDIPGTRDIVKSDVEVQRDEREPGWISAPARPAIADEDMPDSMEQQATPNPPPAGFGPDE